MHQVLFIGGGVVSSIPDVSHSQTHNEQLSRVEVLEMKTRQADEV